MKYKLLFVFLFLLLSLALIAQNHTISGKITKLEQTTGAALQNVRVDIDSSSVITKTDVNGNFSVDIPQGIHNIRVSLPGYIGVFKKDWNITGNTTFNVAMFSTTQPSPGGDITLNLSEYEELNGVSGETEISYWNNGSMWNGVTEGTLIPIRLVNANFQDSAYFKNAIGLCNGHWELSNTNSVEYKQQRNLYLLTNDPQVGVTKKGIVTKFHQGSTNTAVLAYEDNSPFIYIVEVNLRVSNMEIIKKEVQGRAWAKGNVGSWLSYMNGNPVDMTNKDHMLNKSFLNFWAAIARGEQNANMVNLENTPVFPIPLNPSQLTPADKALGLDKLVSISFDNVFGTDWYRVQFSTALDFSSVAKDTIVYKNAFNVLLNPHTKYYWRVMAGNDSGNSGWGTKWEFETKDNIPTSVNDNEFTDYKIYPNPTDSKVTISINQPEINKYIVSIYTIDGQLIENKELLSIDATELTIDLSIHKPGIYFLKISNSKTNRLYKVIKK